MIQTSDHFVQSIDTQVEADLVDLHSTIVKDLGARWKGLHLFSDRRQRDAMIKWRVRLEQFIETADVTYVTTHVPPNIDPSGWIVRLVYYSFGSRCKPR